MSAIRGAAAGFVATFPMTATMQGLRAVLPKEQAREAPPREVIDRTVTKGTNGNSAAVGERERDVATTVAHFAFGAAAGMLYGIAHKSQRATLMTGIMYGLSVWALAYGVVLPSLGLHRAAQDDTEDRNQVLIASHVVWGAVLGYLTKKPASAQARFGEASRATAAYSDASQALPD